MRHHLETKAKALLGAVAFALALGVQVAPASAQDCKRIAGGTVHPPKVVNFAFDSSEIAAEDQAKLKALAEQFAGNPGVEICVLGMTDRSGSEEYNKKLALRRAEAVADFLKTAGLKAGAFQVVGRGQPYGDDHWIGKLLGSAERKSDRRVEVLVMQP